MIKKILFLALLSLFGVGLVFAYAHSARAQDDEEEMEDAPGKTAIYEVPTLKTLSQLYWAILKFDPADNEAVDNYLMINECDLYRDYSQNEFEWNSIREAGRDFVMNNRKDFPIHFELLQPIQFAEYDLDKKEFDVWEPNKIDGVRRFEVLAEDLFDDVCGQSYGIRIPGYPKGLNVELNRPFSLDKIPVDPKVARAFIEAKQEEVNQAGTKIYNREDLYESRNAYLVMKIRVFSYKEDEQLHDIELAKVLGVLEGFEIYGDRDRTLLMYSENYRRKKKRSTMEMEMKKRYQERLKKQMEEKRKAAEEAKEKEAEDAAKAATGQ